MDWTIYVLGDLATFQGVLNGVAMIFSPGAGLLAGSGSLGLGAAIGVGLMVSLIVALASMMMATAGAGKGGSTNLGSLLVIVALLFVMIVPKTRVQLEDVYTGTVAAVDNVPLGVAAPASILSAFTRHLAEKLETTFSTVNGNVSGMLGQGFVQPLRTFMQLRDALKGGNGALASDVQRYILDCKTSNTDPTQFGKTQDLLATIFSNPASGMTTTRFDANGNPTPDLIPVACAVGADRLNKAMEKFLTDMTASSELVAYVRQGASRSGVTSNLTMADIQNHVNTVSTLGASSQDQQKTMAMMVAADLARDAYGCGSAPSYHDFVACSASMTSDMGAWRADAAGSANMFVRSMFPAMNALLGIFFIMAPIVVMTAAMSATHGVNLLVKYFFFGVWTQSWLPFASLINYWTQATLENDLKRVMSGYGGALTPDNIHGAYTLLADKVAVAQNLLAATPMISMAVLSGSFYGLTKLAERMSGDKFNERNLAPAANQTGAVSNTSALHERTGMGRSDYSGNYTQAESGVAHNSSVISASNRQTVGVASALRQSEAASAQASNTFSNLSGRTLSDQKTIRAFEQYGSSWKAESGTQEAMLQSSVRSIMAKHGASESESQAIEGAARASVGMGVNAFGFFKAGVEGIAQKKFQGDKKKANEWVNSVTNSLQTSVQATAGTGNSLTKARAQELGQVLGAGATSEDKVAIAGAVSAVSSAEKSYEEAKKWDQTNDVSFKKSAIEAAQMLGAQNVLEQAALSGVSKEDINRRAASIPITNKENPSQVLAAAALLEMQAQGLAGNEKAGKGFMKLFDQISGGATSNPLPVDADAQKKRDAIFEQGDNVKAEAAAIEAPTRAAAGQAGDKARNANAAIKLPEYAQNGSQWFNALGPSGRGISATQKAAVEGAYNSSMGGISAFVKANAGKVASEEDIIRAAPEKYKDAIGSALKLAASVPEGADELVKEKIINSDMSPEAKGVVGAAYEALKAGGMIALGGAQRGVVGNIVHKGFGVATKEATAKTAQAAVSAGKAPPVVGAGTRVAQDIPRAAGFATAGAIINDGVENLTAPYASAMTGGRPEITPPGGGVGAMATPDGSGVGAMTKDEVSAQLSELKAEEERLIAQLQNNQLAGSAPAGASQMASQEELNQLEEQMERVEALKNQLSGARSRG